MEGYRQRNDLRSLFSFIVINNRKFPMSVFFQNSISSCLRNYSDTLTEALTTKGIDNEGAKTLGRILSFAIKYDWRIMTFNRSSFCYIYKEPSRRNINWKLELLVCGKSLVFRFAKQILA